MDQTPKHHHPTTAPASPTDLLGSGPVADVLRHQDLTLAAKALAIYVLVQPRGRLFTRAEFERLSSDGQAQLDGVLHELTRAGLLAPFPTGERACCAFSFRLHED
jgi:hypothetical protein